MSAKEASPLSPSEEPRATDTPRDISAVSKRASKTTNLVKAPLALGLGAIAVGFVAGLVVPISAFEREKLGPLGGRLTDRARDSAALLVARGKSAVVEVVSAALKPPAK